MTIEELRHIGDPHHLANDQLKALWHQLSGNWDIAHGIVQNTSDPCAQWIHALLHRQEGDTANARYWYSRCGRPYPGDIPFDEEVSAILALLPG